MENYARRSFLSCAKIKNQKRLFGRHEFRIGLVRVMTRKYDEEMKVKVVVMPKAAVLDPQGNAVRDAMRYLGMPEVRSVRIGKYMEIDVEDENGDLEARLHGLCRDLLSNPVIEDYELQKADIADQRKTPNAQPQKPKARKRR